MVMKDLVLYPVDFESMLRYFTQTQRHSTVKHSLILGGRISLLRNELYIPLAAPALMSICITLFQNKIYTFAFFGHVLEYDLCVLVPCHFQVLVLQT